MIKDVIKNKAAAISAGIILIIALLAVFVPFLLPWDAVRQDLASRLSPPGAGHLLGTDALGRDVLTRLLYGTRVSLAVALIPTGLAVLAG
ncbi:MAG: ABC transporter permease, partial [Lachnospiraceae bacterium]|nr:ABC transporter permease [Lachnospiraceae bacterium]